MRTRTRSDIVREIEVLRRLAGSVPGDAVAQASIAAQISALEWVLRFA